MLKKHKTIKIEVDVCIEKDYYQSDIDETTTKVVSKIMTKVTKYVFYVVRCYNFMHSSSKVRVEGVRCEEFPKN